MRHAWRAATAVCLLAVAALSTSSTSLGTPAQAIACFGLAPTIVGSEGSDDLFGTEGNDVIAGLGGNDFIAGLGGDDALCGGPGNDSFVPGPGNDRVDGGGGGVGVGFIELVALSFAPGPVSADLSVGTATGEGSDTLVNVSGLIGGPYGDSLTGNGGVNALFPGGGDDVVDGRGGDDLVGFDLGVQASLVTGSALGEGSDRLVSVEQLSGSDFADVLIGDNGRNYLAGGDGNDLVDGRGGADRVFGDNHDDRVLGGSGDDIVGGDDATDRVLGGDGNDKLLPGAGSDVLVGGKGFDVVSFVRSTTGIKASLLVGRATGQGIDELATVESIDGSQQRDEMIGDGKTNFLFGNSGTDRDQGLRRGRLPGGRRENQLAGGRRRPRLLPHRSRREPLRDHGHASDPVDLGQAARSSDALRRECRESPARHRHDHAPRPSLPRERTDEVQDERSRSLRRPRFRGGKRLWRMELRLPPPPPIRVGGDGRASLVPLLRTAVLLRREEAISDHDRATGAGRAGSPGRSTRAGVLARTALSTRSRRQARPLPRDTLAHGRRPGSTRPDGLPGLDEHGAVELRRLAELRGPSGYLHLGRRAHVGAYRTSGPEAHRAAHRSRGRDEAGQELHVPLITGTSSDTTAPEVAPPIPRR